MLARHTLSLLITVAGWLLAGSAAAQSVFQPLGSSLALGDVTSRSDVRSTAGNPAAPALQSQQRQTGRQRAVVSGAAGLEYGNVEELFQFVDDISRAYKPSGGGQPRPDPGIDIGAIIDSIDPDIRPAVDAIAQEVATQTGILALIASEGYGKAWLAADFPIAWSGDFLGGTWTTHLGWSGVSKAYGVSVPIEFDVDQAISELERWVEGAVGELSGEVALSDQVSLRVDPGSGNIIFVLDNDSSLITKSAQLTDAGVGYSRPAWSSPGGQLYVGVEARLYLMQLSRLSTRLGDITDSEELFKSIRDADFRSATDAGLDVGLLWAAETYQLGAQLTNVNQPTFDFPDVDLEPYRDTNLINFLERDRRYVLDRQLKLEASFFPRDRRWAAHLGIDADPATDAMGDRFQWATASLAMEFDKPWLSNLRLGYRQNLAGTELEYVNVGATAFRYLNIDLASALDSVRIDGRSLPQGLMVSVGVQFSW